MLLLLDTLFRRELSKVISVTLRELTLSTELSFPQGTNRSSTWKENPLFSSPLRIVSENHSGWRLKRPIQLSAAASGNMGSIFPHTVEISHCSVWFYVNSLNIFFHFFGKLILGCSQSHQKNYLKKTQKSKGISFFVCNNLLGIMWTEWFSVFKLV